VMLHDEIEYPEPFEFLPERWILEDGQKQPRDPTKVAFGFGRRCVYITYWLDTNQSSDDSGKDLAEHLVSSNFSRICHFITSTLLDLYCHCHHPCDTGRSQGHRHTQATYHPGWKLSRGFPQVLLSTESIQKCLLKSVYAVTQSHLSVQSHRAHLRL
jgi:hypothetical protein